MGLKDVGKKIQGPATWLATIAGVADLVEKIVHVVGHLFGTFFSRLFSRRD